MEKVSSIFEGMYLGEYAYYSLSSRTLPEEIKFYTGVALTSVLPPFLLSIAFAQSQLFVLLMLNATLGVLLGVILFNRPPAGVAHCVPTGRLPQVPSGANPAHMKKAA
jgi:hypothetical protein